jgi:hypothetical protein
MEVIVMTDDLGLEQPVEDVLEQRRARGEDEVDDDLLDADLPLESNEADAVEQHIVVPEEEDEDRA